MSEQIRTCSSCHQEVKINTGLNSDNWKKLWRMPTSQEWIILFMMVMVMVLAYAYKTETAQARETLKNLPQICTEYNSNNFAAISDKYNINFTTIDYATGQKRG